MTPTTTTTSTTTTEAPTTFLILLNGYEKQVKENNKINQNMSLLYGGIQRPTFYQQFQIFL
jgi:hypothetical protein